MVMRRQFVHHLFAALLLLTHVVATFAHDFWILPSLFRAGVNTPIPVSLYVGELPPGEPYTRHNIRIERFADINLSLDPSEQKDIPVSGEDNASPAGLFTPTVPGLHVLAYRGKAAFIQLEADRFEAYLKSHDLYSISAQRARAGQSDAPGKEKYSRCCKSFVRIDPIKPDPATPMPVAHFDQPIGLRLEIVPLADPYALPPPGDSGTELKVLVLFDKRPLSDAKVSARDLKDPAAAPVSATTNSAGQAVLSLANRGSWLITTIAMTAAPAGISLSSSATLPTTGPTGLFVPDWESTWSSFTFDNSAP